MKNPLLKTAARCLFIAVLGASTSLFGQPTPVLHLSFDNVSGTTVFNDGSGSGMDGTMNGTATIVAGGMFGNALQVTGGGSADGSVRIANAVVPLNVQAGSTWTVACWIKSSTQGGTWMYQGDGGWASGNTTLAMLVNNGTTGVNGPAAGGVRYASGWEQGTTAVNDGNWHHIVLTWDGTTKVQYIDGVVDTWVADQWANSAGTGAQFWVGGGGPGEGDGQVGLQGLVDEAYVFDVALSASDVQKLYTINSLTGTPVPAAVTVSPTSGFRGAVFTVTATATPVSGTVTNATANLSALGLSSAAALVQSDVANVFTNSFTVPTNAPVGLHNIIVTVKDTEPLVGTASTNFFVLATPPTNATVVTQLTSKTVHAYTEVSFRFNATNDAPNSTNNAFFSMSYAWYTNTVLVSTNPMGPYYTFLTTPDNNGMAIQCIASINDDTNYYSYLSVTSAPATLTITAGTPVYTNGLKEEVFSGVTSRANVYIGNTPPGVIHLVTAADSTGGFGDNTSRRYSGYFIPPTTDSYVFFLASDDDCDLFLSTNSTSPADKLLIAHETGYSGQDSWQTAGGNGTDPTQTRSDTWTNSAGAKPYAGGILLTGGQAYYIESVEHNGTGGDNWGVTYETETELAADATQPLDGSPSRMTAATNNIAVVTWPGTTVGWVNDLTPTSVSILEGGTTNFTAFATNDAEMAVTYQGYINGVLFPGATSTNFILSSIPVSYNGASIYIVASNPEGGISITSRVAVLHVTQAVHETGFLKDERWDGSQYSTGSIINNTVPATPNYQMAVPEAGVGQDNGGGHNNFVRRVSGYFVVPTTTYYNLHLTSDDDSVLFLSTDDTPANKQEVASQAGWNGGARWDWGVIGGGTGANDNLQTHSETYTSDGIGGTVHPKFDGINGNDGGILLLAGQRYYIEDDMHQGGGGANMAFTWSLFGSDPAVGTETQLKGSSIQMNVPRCTYVAFTSQPHNIANVKLGSYVSFSAPGTTDSQVSIGAINGYEETYANNKLFYQWFTNGVAVSNANSSYYLFGPVTSDSVGVVVNCQARALGYTDDSLNPIWTNSTSGSITSVVAAAPPGLVGEFVSGAANLNDTANFVAPGLYYGVPARAASSSQYYYFTNDVPPGKSGVSLVMGAYAIAITNTAASDPGYVDTFDGTLATNFTVMTWAKGSFGSWIAFVTKGGDNGWGWALRNGQNADQAAWTVRGNGGAVGVGTAIYGNSEDLGSTNTWTDGQWHHYAGVLDLKASITNVTPAVTNIDTTQDPPVTNVTAAVTNVVQGIRSLYVDGNLVGKVTGEGAYTDNSAGHLTFGTEDLPPGNNYGNNGWLSGKMYDVRIYNYALTQPQIVTAGGILPSKPVFGPGQGPGGGPGVVTGPNGPQFVLTYTNATLLSSTNVAGPWTPVPGATSPYTNILDSAMPDMFYILSTP